MEAAGYTCTRATGSLGVFDVIGTASKDVVLPQVKSNAWPGIQELERIRTLPAPANCRKLIHSLARPQKIAGCKRSLNHEAGRLKMCNLL